MIKFYAVIEGLFVTVLPDQKDDPAMVLIVRTDGGLASDGGVIHPHESIVKFSPRTFNLDKCIPVSLEKAAWALEGEDIMFLPDGSEPCGGVKIKNREYFYYWERVLGKGATRIRQGCLGDNPTEQCTVGGRPALSGRVILKGGTLRPVNIINRKQVSCISSGEIWGFRSLSTGARSDVLLDIFTGLLFEMEIEDEEEFRLRIGNTLIPLERDEITIKCEEDEEAKKEECLLVLIENTSRQHEAGEFIVDRHYELFYDLLERNFDDRFVPYRKVFINPDEDSGADPPGSRCIPGSSAAGQ